MTERQTDESQQAIRPRVIIAEDSVLIQENIRKAVERHCEVVAAVEDGAAVLAAIDTHSPDILLLDLSLPDMSGFAVLERLVNSKSRTMVIILTAHAERSYVERAFELGTKGYVLKGKMWTDLPAAIQEVLTGGTYQSALLARAPAPKSQN